MNRLGLILTAVAVLVGTVAVDAEAQRRGGRGGRQEAQRPPEPTEPNPSIVALLNGMEWGWSKDQVITALRQEVRNKYWPQIQAASNDVVTEQRLRVEMEKEQERIAQSCVAFDGSQTAWNVSMIDKEFTHNNQEEMCKFDRGDATDFYFFIRGKLWKVFRTLSGTLAAAPPTFDEMRATMEGQFGPGEDVREVDPYRLVSEVVAVRWIDSVTDLQMRWLDLYGVYAVVLTERATLANLASLRRGVTPGAGETDTTGLTQAVTEGTAVDEHSDIVDRLRGDRPDPTAPQPQTPPPTPAPRP